MFNMSPTISLFLVSQCVEKVGKQSAPIEPQYFTKDQNQNHADEDSALLHVCSYAHITHHTYRVPCCQTGHAHTEARTKMTEAGEQVVVLLWRRVHAIRDQDSYDQGIYCNDSGHDHRYQRLHDEIWSESADTRDSDACFGCTVGCTCAWRRELEPVAVSTMCFRISHTPEYHRCRYATL